MFRGINVCQHAFIKHLCSNPDASADPEAGEFLRSSPDPLLPNHFLALSFIVCEAEVRLGWWLLSIHASREHVENVKERLFYMKVPPSQTKRVKQRMGECT